MLLIFEPFPVSLIRICFEIRNSGFEFLTLSLRASSVLARRAPGSPLSLSLVTRSAKRKTMLRQSTIALSVFALELTAVAAAESSKNDPRLTQLIREVNLLAPDVPVRPAVLNENVRETTAVRTGGESRAELTFTDLTITRLGANTLYRFKKAGRLVDLTSGSTLLRVPKD